MIYNKIDMKVCFQNERLEKATIVPITDDISIGICKKKKTSYDYLRFIFYALNVNVTLHKVQATIQKLIVNIRIDVDTNFIYFPTFAVLPIKAKRQHSLDNVSRLFVHPRLIGR